MVRAATLDDMLSKNIWFSCPKSSNNWNKLRCQACDLLTNGKWKVKQYSVWAESAIFMCPAPFLPLYDHFEIWRSLDGSGTNSCYLVLWQLLKSKDRRKGELIKVNLLFKWNRKKEKSDTLLLFKKKRWKFLHLERNLNF